MSPTHALRLAPRPSLSASYRAQAQARVARPAAAAALLQARHYAAGGGKDDDLGGPGGQEPPDPKARAEQNARLRNTVMVGSAVAVAVPMFYMIGRPRKVAEEELRANLTGRVAGHDPAEPLERLSGGRAGGEEQQQQQRGG